MNLINLTGKKFGRLKAIKRIFPNKKHNQVKWLCKCDCGTEKIVDGHHLRRGSAISCGCYRREVGGLNAKLGFGIAAMRATIKIYRRGAKLRGLKFELTDDQFKKITQENCFLCGAEPGNNCKNRNGNGDYIYNGIDRIDNNKGYTINNVVACCFDCNRAKGNRTLQEYKSWIGRSYKKQF